MSIRTRERAMLEADLHQAVRKQQLQLHYQPIIDMPSGRIAGLEALVRWQHPRLGLLQPDNFIPIAEDIGLVYAIDAWVLDEACRQLRTWQTEGQAGSDLIMSVNMSGHHLRGTDVFDRVVGAIQTHGLRPANLKLEVTESAVIRDATAACRMLQALKAAGVQLAIDDFGVGYSSLSYLRHFSVDTLKIDRSFVTALGEEPKATAIVQAVTLLAHVLGLNVTVEGVESSAQAAEIRRLGCDYGQGFYFSRPLPADEAVRLLS
jgi:EAL domain-containing protein (putative c-di-GMP-specific phosphodiesterase class I)